MRAAVAITALAVACCFAAQGDVNAKRDAADPKAQTSVPDALAVPNCKSYESMMDRLRLGAAEYSESGMPLSKKVWRLVVRFRKAQIDKETWAWFQESVDAPSTVPALRDAHSDFRPATLELVRTAMAIDAETATGPGSATPDDLALSVWRQLIRQEFAEDVAFSRIHLAAEYATRPHGLRDPAIWTTFAATLTPHEDVYNAFGYGTFDVLQAIYAASDNKLVMETHHLDGYNLLKMVGYQVAQRLMLDAMIDVAMTCGAVESCGESGDCETVAEAGARTCETAADFCRTSRQAGQLGICDALPRRCRYAVDCVRRTAQGADTDGNCIVDSWESLRSSELPSLEGVASSEGEAPPTP